MAARGRKRFLTRMGVVVDDDDEPGSATTPAFAPAPSVAGPAGWDAVRVARWLTELGFKQYGDAFKNHHVTGAVLPLLSKDVLKSDLGINSLGHRLLIVQGVRALFPEAPASGGSASVSTRLADVEGQANKAASLVFSGQGEVRKLSEQVGALKREVAQASASVQELAKASTKPSAAPLSAESQARLNKALKQAEGVEKSLGALKEDMAGLRSEMHSTTSTLATRAPRASPPPTPHIRPLGPPPPARASAHPPPLARAPPLPPHPPPPPFLRAPSPVASQVSRRA